MKALSSIVEWRPARFDIFGPMQLVLLALIGTALLRPIRLQPVRLALLLGLIHMALHQGRHQMVLGVIAPMLLAEPLAQAFAEDRRAEADDRRVWRGASVLMAFLIAVRLLLPIARVDGPTAPISALSAVPGTLRQKPVFNELGFGGYLIFSGVKPYIDGRFDMYGDAYFTRQDAIVTGDVAAFDAEVARHGIAWTLLPPSAPLNRVLAGRADWKRIFGDEIAVIYAKR